MAKNYFKSELTKDGKIVRNYFTTTAATPMAALEEFRQLMKKDGVQGTLSTPVDANPAEFRSEQPKPQSHYYRDGNGDLQVKE